MKYKSHFSVRCTLRCLLVLGTSTLLTAKALGVTVATDTTKPLTFWYWMYGAVSKAGIRADLQAMKDAGIGGCYLMPIRSSKDAPQYHGTADQFTPAFWDSIDETFRVADSLGLSIGIHISDGFALAGSPAITPAESMQKVVWTDTIVPAKDVISMTLKQPETVRDYYQDIACYAYNNVKRPWQQSLLAHPIRCKHDTAWTVDLDTQHTIRSLQVILSGNNIQGQRLKIEALGDDGKQITGAYQLTPPRQGWQSSGAPFTFALLTMTARYLRLSWTPQGNEPGSEDLDAAKWSPVLKVKQLIVSDEPRIDQWEGKSGASWRIAATEPIEIKDRDCLTASPVTLTLQDGRVVAANGSLSGNVRILRFGHTSTGQENATGGGGKGLEADKFSRRATLKLLDNWYALFLQRPHAQVVKGLHIDSWECGTQNWGTDFATAFRQRRGYDLLPYLPVYAGYVVESTERSEQVLRDIRLTVNDLVRDVFFQTVKERADEWGKTVTHESIAPTFIADGMEHYRLSDRPMGEFWFRSPTHDKPADMLDAISGAHLYGKNIIQAEGFTELRGTWDETPAMLKPLLDREYALGLNRLVFHVMAHNPWIDRKPGMTLDGIGLFFQRDNTWFHESKAFVDYIRRCQQWLQKGTPVVDLAVFTGEEMPRRALTPDRLTTILPGLFGTDRFEQEQQRLDAGGVTMTESPIGVRHVKGILDMKDWVNCLKGYHYDSMNADALLREAVIKDGTITMPGGVAYRALVLPGKTKMDPTGTLSEAVKEKIAECRRNGVAIINRPYTKDDLHGLGIRKDVDVPTGIGFAHRSLTSSPDRQATDPKEIYFLTNQDSTEVTFSASFRGQSKKALCFQPVDSTYKELAVSHHNGRTEMQVDLVAYGSCFILLSDHRLPQAPPYSHKDETTSIQLPLKDWTVRFEENGIKKIVDLPYDFRREPNDSLRFFSGHITFTKTFTLHKPKGRIVLPIGDSHHVVTVNVNGIDCGTIWTAPYEADITRALRNGTNTFRVTVVNTWDNALRGADRGTPPYAGIWTNGKYRAAPTVKP